MGVVGSLQIILQTGLEQRNRLIVDAEEAYIPGGGLEVMIRNAGVVLDYDIAVGQDDSANGREISFVHQVGRGFHQRCTRRQTFEITSSAWLLFQALISK